VSLFRNPPSGDPYLVDLSHVVRAGLGGLEPSFVGWRHDGTDQHVRFRAPLSIGFVRVQIQGEGAGEGGSAYHATDFIDSVEVDCREVRVQDVAFTVAYARFWIYLIPVLKDPDGTTTLLNGVGTVPDHMSFIDVGV
jgi:hypothetical protein